MAEINEAEINRNLMKMRDAEKRFGLVRNSRAVQQIGKAIKDYEANISSGKGAYFSMFRILD